MRKIIGLLAVFILSASLAGCSANSGGSSGSKDNAGGKQQDVMAEFSSLMETDPGPDQIIGFIDKNISSADQEDASSMIDGLESAQKDHLDELENKFYSEDIQKEINDAYKPGSDLNDLEGVTDEQLKDLLKETKDSGYKLETAEGMYYPIIDYGFYKKYADHLTPDFADYINIMSVESDAAPAKDAELVIGWSDLIKRALSQEAFIQKYPGSKRVEEVTGLYKNYAAFIFLGLNNTPLYDYDTHIMNADAITAYRDAIGKDGGSKLIGKLNGFLDIAEKNNYRLTEEVDKYRHDTLSSL